MIALNCSHFSKKIASIPLTVLYGIFMLFAGGVGLIMTPPFLVPDEPSHFIRAYQVAQGGMTGTRISPTQSGAYLPETVEDIAKPFTPFFTDKGEKITGSILAQAFDMQWSTPPVFVNMPNTVVYPPTSYIGGAAGIFVAQRLNASPFGTFYLARAGSLILNTCLGMLALWIAGDAGVFLLILLAMPACVSLEASCSQDGLVLGLTALAVSILLQLAKRPVSDWNNWLVVGLSLTFGCIAAAKVPYLSFICLPFLICPLKDWKKPLSILGGGLVFFLLWTLIQIQSSVPLLGMPGSSSAEQLHYLLNAPAKVINVTLTTLRLKSGHLFRQVMGMLGWGYVNLPKKFYTLGEIALFLSFMWPFFGRLKSVRNKEFLIRTSLLLGVFLITTEGIFMVLYLVFSPVGASYVFGLQGRYFIPLFMILALCPAFLPKNATNENATSALAKPCLMRVFLALFMLYSLCTLYSTLSAHYW
ncbi:DUF2142 domain-containing protein [Acetobacter sp. LMG 32666]|uniref:DUF2142 domain-containing protein n=1 Tax=Acetobacter sp. LMG 32666 TaxID=2959295 RepID=UPI0030C89D2C